MPDFPTGSNPIAALGRDVLSTDRMLIEKNVTTVEDVQKAILGAVDGSTVGSTREALMNFAYGRASQVISTGGAHTITGSIVAIETDADVVLTLPNATSAWSGMILRLNASYDGKITLTSAPPGIVYALCNNRDLSDPIGNPYVLAGSTVAGFPQIWEIEGKRDDANAIELWSCSSTTNLERLADFVRGTRDTIAHSAASATLGLELVNRVTYADGIFGAYLPSSEVTWPVGATRRIVKANGGVHGIVLTPPSTHTICGEAAGVPVTLEGSAIAPAAHESRPAWDVTRVSTTAWEYTSEHVRRSPKWSDYDNAIAYIAHRGSALMYPEHTYEAYEACIAQGFPLVELDCHFLSDGVTLVSMHDATIDATTTGTGNVSAQTEAQWRALAIDANDWHGSNFGNTLQAPTVAEALRRLKGRAIVVPEVKATGSGAALVAALQAEGYSTEEAIVTSFSVSELTAAVAAGYPTLLATDGTADKATAWAAGIRIVTMAGTVADATFSAWIAYGFRVIGYAVYSRFRRDQLLALGVTGFYADDVAYLSRDTPIRTTDAFALNTWSPGMVDTYNGYSLGEAVRGRFYSGYWGFGAGVIAGDSFVHMGYLNPVKGDPNCDDFTVDFKVTFDSANGGDDTRWASIFIGDSDAPWQDTGISSTSLNGYHALCRKDGRLQIYKLTAGVAALLGTTNTATITDGTEVEYRLTVTPTEVAIARLTGTTGTYTAADASFRCGYIALNRNGLACRFRDVVVA